MKTLYTKIDKYRDINPSFFSLIALSGIAQKSIFMLFLTSSTLMISGVNTAMAKGKAPFKAGSLSKKKCKVTSGMHKGKKGHYTEGSKRKSCVGSWGGQRCHVGQKSSCKNLKKQRAPFVVHYNGTAPKTNGNYTPITDSKPSSQSYTPIGDSKPSSQSYTPITRYYLFPRYYANKSVEIPNDNYIPLGDRSKNILTGSDGDEKVFVTTDILKEYFNLPNQSNFKECGFGVCVCSGEYNCDDLFSYECNDKTTKGACSGSGENTTCMCYPKDQSNSHIGSF